MRRQRKIGLPHGGLTARIVAGADYRPQLSVAREPGRVRAHSRGRGFFSGNAKPLSFSCGARPTLGARLLLMQERGVGRDERRKTKRGVEAARRQAKEKEV